MRGWLVRALALFGCCTAVWAAAPEKGKEAPPVLQFKVKNIQGKEVDLSQYQGKAVLIVNVASECGYTPQYEGLQALYEKYKDKGLVVLGFPSNDFGRQEPGTDEEIQAFCSSKYGVKFDMFSKVVVKGKGQSELYGFLTSETTNPKFAGPVKWNFEKFLLDKKGEVVGRFGSGVAPDSKELVAAIESALGD